MTYIRRLMESRIQDTLQRGKSVLLIGPRQTGKTTLLAHQIQSDCTLNFADSELRLEYEMSPGLLKATVKAVQPSKGRKIPLIILDEIQKVPVLMDIIQILIDDKQAQFILTGSSVRKLKRNKDININLLPGRVIGLHLDPLCLLEMPQFPELETLLLYGSLPGIFFENKKSLQDEDLKNYVIHYLEEEIRAEAVVRNIGSFARFLECAALESGQPINMERVSQDVGVKRNTIVDYYQILLDCLIADRIEPITRSDSRQRLTKASKYLFFDLGVRRVCAREGTQLSEKTLASLFEQWVGIELLRYLRLLTLNGQLRYWRDHNGPEVDYVVDIHKKYIPIEVKWTTRPDEQDIMHLAVFLKEYECYPTAYLICRCKRRLKLAERIIALPWQEMSLLAEELGKF
jgi:predicted AAA+ superfamily ATPase